MAEDERDRLNKLAELRRGGVLSETEYQTARARLRARAQQEDDEEDEQGSSLIRSYWPALVGLLLLVVMIIGVVV
jgi:cytochrome c-type biogenesis protein CcmH/NrfG